MGEITPFHIMIAVFVAILSLAIFKEYKENKELNKDGKFLDTFSDAILDVLKNSEKLVFLGFSMFLCFAFASMSTATLAETIGKEESQFTFIISLVIQLLTTFLTLRFIPAICESYIQPSTTYTQIVLSDFNGLKFGDPPIMPKINENYKTFFDSSSKIKISKGLLISIIMATIMIISIIIINQIVWTAIGTMLIIMWSMSILCGYYGIERFGYKSRTMINTLIMGTLIGLFYGIDLYIVFESCFVNGYGYKIPSLFVAGIDSYGNTVVKTSSQLIELARNNNLPDGTYIQQLAHHFAKQKTVMMLQMASLIMFSGMELYTGYNTLHGGNQFKKRVQQKHKAEIEDASREIKSGEEMKKLAMENETLAKLLSMEYKSNVSTRTTNKQNPSTEQNKTTKNNSESSVPLKIVHIEYNITNTSSATSNDGQIEITNSEPSDKYSLDNSEFTDKKKYTGLKVGSHTISRKRDNSLDTKQYFRIEQGVKTSNKIRVVSPTNLKTTFDESKNEFTIEGLINGNEVVIETDAEYALYSDSDSEDTNPISSGKRFKIQINSTGTVNYLLENKSETIEVILLVN